LTHLCNKRNSKLEISKTPTKAKSRVSAYSQALNQKDKIGESGRGTVRRLGWMVRRERASVDRNTMHALQMI